MGTLAKQSFDENWSTITNLMSLVGPDGTTTHAQRAARNQAALIFCITAWEGYVEDLLKQASTYIATRCESFDQLPKKVQQALLNAVTPQTGPGSKSPSGSYPQHLADDGWRSLLIDLAARATEGSNFNTPKSKAVKELFEDWCGLDVTTAWSWQKFKAPGPSDRLDESIVIRGQIIHTGSKPSGLNANWIKTYGENNIRNLVDRTDAAVITHVSVLCPSSSLPQFGA